MNFPAISHEGMSGATDNMSKLSKVQRAHIAPANFAGPSGSYPIPDISHARNALSGASHALNVGNISHAQFQQIRAHVFSHFPELKQHEIINNAIHGKLA